MNSLLKLRSFNHILTKNAFNIGRYYSTVSLLDGRSFKYDNFKNSNEILKSLSRNEKKSPYLLSKVDGKELYDLNTQIPKDKYFIEFLGFEDRDARLSYWKSCSIHLIEAVKEYYKSKDEKIKIVNYGPLFSVDGSKEDNINQGSFFVDIYFEDKTTIKEPELYTFRSKLLHFLSTKSLAQFNGDVKFLESNNFSVVENENIKHIPFINKVTQHFSLIKNSAIISDEYGSLQRIIGISFPDSDSLVEWTNAQKLAASLDHRVVGKNQELFFFHPYSPGSSFFLPHGTRIYNTLLNFLRKEYRKRGYEEVISPNIYDQKLWETSGHWDNYQKNMFSFDCDDTKYSLKPMNCPGHCLMYAHKNRSYKELPIRYADFGVLHRNEVHGALTGLTRVRRFQQDDAHIFCTHEMIKDEIKGCLDFMKYVYSIFGFEFRLELSTRPTPFLGEVQTWDHAENALKEVLNEFDPTWTLNPGDGAFYGPKIDIHLKDALGKSHQCATIQLDFQLPQRFNLEYQSNDQNQLLMRPVMIHRAIFGSVERMLAVLMEHTGGKWPLWLSPRQVLVIPVKESFTKYSNEVNNKLKDLGFYSDIDYNTADTLSKRVRSGFESRYNYILFLGGSEEGNKSVTFKIRDDKNNYSMPFDEFVSKLQSEVANFK